MNNPVSFTLDLDHLTRYGTALAILKPPVAFAETAEPELPLSTVVEASTDNVVTTEEPVKKVRAPSLNRKPSVRMTREMAFAAKFLLAKGKEKEEVAQEIGTSVSSVSRLIVGDYNEKFGL